MSYIVVPYKAEHLLRLTPREYEAHEFTFLGVNEYSELYERGPGYTLLYNDIVVASAGVIKFWKGVGEGWFRGSPHIYEHRSKVMHATMVGFKMIRDSGYHRIQATILKGFDAAIEFAERLGFKYECEIRKYGADKRDYLLYSIVED